MTAAEQVKAAKKFAAKWMKDCKEDGNTAPFWISLLREVFGVTDTDSYIRFEDTVKHEEKGNSLFIDGWIPSMRIMIEQKAAGVPLDKPYKRHGRTFASAYEQAFEYDQTLPVSQRSRYILTSNFHEIWIYNMDEAEATRKPMKLTLEDLPEHFHQLDFLVDEHAKPREMEEIKISVKAGALVGRLYDALLKEYRDPKSVASQKSLNVLCVRIVFCLYAEDSGLFGAKNSFSNYLEGWRWENARDALQQLFRVLDTKAEDRDPYLKEDLMAFPYVNGGLFHDEHIEIPRITKEIFDIIVEDMSKGCDWSAISPTIFGAVFESTLNPETRRSGGMHYTSIANIHKVIDPLFLDDLEKEFQEIISIPEEQKILRSRKEPTLRYDYRNRLEAFQKKLSSLTFLDPAAGSGNFLTETFLSLRRLENRVIDALTGGQQLLDLVHPIKVSISQFYGIEINDFAVTVAKTALWIAESQMMQETEHIIRKNLDFLPLKTNAFIHEGNALRMDWEEIISKDKLSYIMGNPPFVGGMMMSAKQRAELANVFPECKAVGEADYVTGWYAKAVRYIVGSKIRCAFVSTNSICQGQSVASVWKPLINKGVKIDFAYRTFVWDNEANLKAHVHCVIVGFSSKLLAVSKFLYDESNVKKSVDNINPYLLDAETVFVESRSKPLCDVPDIKFGSMPRDGGGFILNKEEKCKLEHEAPLAAKWIHPYIGALEFLKNKERWCLWLKGVSPSEIKKCPFVLQRVSSVRDFRLKSKAAGTRKFAETPTLFAQIAQPENGNYIAVPKTSSERRRYLPIGFLDSNVIASDLLFLIPHATIYHLGVLTSNVHMAWMRVVAGRLKSDYRYSKDIVYNNFPWPSPTEEQKARIEKTAQGILDARAKYPNDSLADLYDPLLMPADLRRAHAENDKAVMDAYGFPWRTMKEEDCVAELMKMYEKLTVAAK